SVAIPARALAQKAYPTYRAVCFRPGFRHKTDEVAEATQPQAALQILAGADVQPALPQEYVASIHRAGAGETGNRLRDVQYGLPRADGHHSPSPTTCSTLRGDCWPRPECRWS